MDIVERLRATYHASGVLPHDTVLVEAVLEIDRLRADNAAMLAALKAMVERYASEDQWEMPMECDVNARAAIAKAEGHLTDGN